MELRDLRIKAGLTQKELADKAGISLRTYITYENKPEKRNKIKYDYLIRLLEDLTRIDEENGVLTIDSITKECAEVFRNYDVDFCYLFGSYAKNKATAYSDVDLLVSTNTKGLKFYGLIEQIRERIKKNVDILDFNQLKDNLSLTNEIMKDGIKIYG